MMLSSLFRASCVVVGSGSFHRCSLSFAARKVFQHESALFSPASSQLRSLTPHHQHKLSTISLHHTKSSALSSSSSSLPLSSSQQRTIPSSPTLKLLPHNASSPLKPRVLSSTTAACAQQQQQPQQQEQHASAARSTATQADQGADGDKSSSTSSGGSYIKNSKSKNNNNNEDDDDAKIPFAAGVLGYAGAIPFVGSAGALVLVEASVLPFSLSPVIINAQLSYGASILSFLGGVHWGVALDSSSHSFKQAAHLTYGVVPSLVAWSAWAFFPPLHAACILVAGLSAAYVVDQATLRTHPRVPKWYLRLRTPLSLAATGSLAVTVAAQYFLH